MTDGEFQLTKHDLSSEERGKYSGSFPYIFFSLFDWTLVSSVLFFFLSCLSVWYMFDRNVCQIFKAKENSAAYGSQV